MRDNKDFLYRLLCLIIWAVSMLFIVSTCVVFAAVRFDALSLILGLFEQTKQVAGYLAWGTKYNMIASIGINIVYMIVFYIKSKSENKDDSKFLDKVSLKLVTLFTPKSKRTILSAIALASKAQILTKIIEIVPATFNLMTLLHGIGLVFGMEQQPFVKGLCSFGSLSNFLVPFILMVVVFGIQIVQLLLTSTACSVLDNFQPIKKDDDVIDVEDYTVIDDENED